jgi:phage-related protein
MLAVIFYRTAGGSEPVREWLRTLSREERAVIGEDLRTVQFGFPIGMPLCRPLGRGLSEVRSSLPTRKEARLVFFATNDRLVVVNGFIKKRRKTPTRRSLLLSSARSNSSTTNRHDYEGTRSKEACPKEPSCWVFLGRLP